MCFLIKSDSDDFFVFKFSFPLIWILVVEQTILCLSFKLNGTVRFSKMAYYHYLQKKFSQELLKVDCVFKRKLYFSRSSGGAQGPHCFCSIGHFTATVVFGSRGKTKGLVNKYEIHLTQWNKTHCYTIILDEKKTIYGLILTLEDLILLYMIFLKTCFTNWHWLCRTQCPSVVNVSQIST